MANTQEVPVRVWEAVVEFNKWARGRSAEVAQAVRTWLASGAEEALPGDTEAVMAARALSRLVAATDTVVLHCSRLSKGRPRRLQLAGLHPILPGLRLTLNEEIMVATLVLGMWEQDEPAILEALECVRTQWGIPPAVDSPVDAVRGGLADVKEKLEALSAAEAARTELIRRVERRTRPLAGLKVVSAEEMKKAAETVATEVVESKLSEVVIKSADEVRAQQREDERTGKLNSPSGRPKSSLKKQERQIKLWRDWLSAKGCGAKKDEFLREYNDRCKEKFTTSDLDNASRIYRRRTTGK